MKTAILTTAVMLILSASTTQANHLNFAKLEEQVFGLQAEGRIVRWEIKRDFQNDPEYRGMVRDMTLVYQGLGNLQEDMFQERNLPFICNRIDTIHKNLHRLIDRLEHCSFSGSVHKHVPPGARNANRNSIHHRRHAGYVHVADALKHLSVIDAGLVSLHQQIDPTSVGAIVPYTLPAPAPHPDEHDDHRHDLPRGPVLVPDRTSYSTQSRTDRHRESTQATGRIGPFVFRISK